MECPHLANSIKIDRDFIKTIKLDQSSLVEGSTGSAGAAVSTSSKQWRCSGKHFSSHTSIAYTVNGFECRGIFLSSQPDPDSLFMRPLTNKYTIVVC